jgi:hypothetical protein
MVHFIITSEKDVYNFFSYLHNQKKTAFHPDDDFFDYVNLETGEPAFTAEEAEHYNKVMDDAVVFCNANDIDIYGIAIDMMVF